MKKKQKQSPQILSPENYIRQRSRNLPIFKCFVNEDWKDTGIVYVIIARKHINGNITCCSYLVDLKCLGVKDTLYEFNVSEDEFNEYKRKVDTSLNMIESDYNLVHNIIHAGWEYAGDIGFEPHKDFLSITRYMLEEDSDDIPLIEIACGGENGKPLFVQGPLEDDAIANTIINRLEKRLGAGNFDYLLGGNNPMFDKSYDDWDDEDDRDDLDIFHDEYIDNSHNENVAIFLKLTQHLDDEEFDDDRDGEDPDDDENFRRIEALTDILYDDLADFEEVNKWVTKWRKEARDYTITNAAYYQMLGLQNEDEVAYEDLSYLSKEEDEAKLQKYVSEKWGKLPYVTFFELHDIDDPEERKEKIARALDQYPDHALLKLEDKTAKILDKRFKKTELSFNSSFGDRKEITPYEYVKWQVVRLHYFASTYDLTGIESLFLFNDPEIYTEHHQISMFLSVLYATRISVLRMFLLQYSISPEQD